MVFPTKPPSSFITLFFISIFSSVTPSYFSSYLSTYLLLILHMISTVIQPQHFLLSYQLGSGRLCGSVERYFPLYFLFSFFSHILDLFHSCYSSPLLSLVYPTNSSRQHPDGSPLFPEEDCFLSKFSSEIKQVLFLLSIR